MRRVTIRNALRDSGIFVLGANLWASQLLIPLLHLSAAERPTGLLLAAAIPLLLLIVGVLLSSPTVLLGVVPISLLAPLLWEPRLVGANVFSAANFGLVAISALGYGIGGALLLQLGASPAGPSVLAQIEERVILSGRHRRVFRMLALMAGIFPGVLVWALFLDPVAREAVRQRFPERGPEALVLFGILALGLWLAAYRRYFYSPLAVQVRGDRVLETELVVLRHAVRRTTPRARFYAWVAVALAAMAALLLTRR